MLPVVYSFTMVRKIKKDMHQTEKAVHVAISVEQTKKIAGDLAEQLLPGDVVALYGDLGSGKTTFTQALAYALGVKKRLISPTFTLVRRYSLPGQPKNIHTFYHIDLYRMSTKADLSLGLKEILADGSAVTVIEWAEKLDFMPENKRIDIVFEYISGTARKIIVSCIK